MKYKVLAGGHSYATFHIPWTKTTHFEGADIIVSENGEPTSPVAALRHHQHVNASVPLDAPFFAFEAANKKGWAPMTRTWFIERCNEVWKTAGLETLTGHYFRIGSAMELLLRGMAPDIVAV